MGKKIISIKQVIENEVVIYEAHSRNTEKLKMTKAVVEARAAALEEQCREQERTAREAEGETALGRELEAVRRVRGELEGEAAKLGAQHGGQQVVERETEERRAEVARQERECLELEGDSVHVVRVTQEDVAELELELEVAAGGWGSWPGPPSSSCTWRRCWRPRDPPTPRCSADGCSPPRGSPQTMWRGSGPP
jgi:hypothetical protein